MNIEQNKYITKPLARLLSKDEWTMALLATAQYRRLMMYKGVGKTTAHNIIKEARRLVNEAKLNEAAAYAVPEATAPESSEDDPPMSARVRRIRGLDA